MKLLLACLCALNLIGGSAFAADAKPNIIFLLADDLGYGDIGAFGQKKIRTPNLDRLAKDGMRFTQHYSGHNVCAPSRCVLMTGKHPGHAYIRNNRGGFQQATLKGDEGQEPVPPGELKLPLTLKQLGYTNGGFGKWGLGAVGSTGDPNSQGMDRFFGYNDQGVAHNYYPTHLWNNRERVPLRNERFSARQKLPTGADPKDPASYATFTGKDYAPDLINEAARKFLRENKDRPFFLYYPTTVPHLALQVPEDSLAEYKDAFPEEPYTGAYGYLPHRTPRAAYAAMVTRLDREIGKLLALVDEFGLRENTIVVFSSDNGPLRDGSGGSDTAFFNSNGGLRGRKGGYYEGRLQGAVHRSLDRSDRTRHHERARHWVRGLAADDPRIGWREGEHAVRHRRNQFCADIARPHAAGTAIPVSRVAELRALRISIACRRSGATAGP